MAPVSTARARLAAMLGHAQNQALAEWVRRIRGDGHLPPLSDDGHPEGPALMAALVTALQDTSDEPAPELFRAIERYAHYCEKAGHSLESALREWRYLKRVLLRIPGLAGGSVLSDMLDDAMIALANALAKQRETDLQTQAQRKDLFLGMLGHDLRNPITAILASAQMGIRNLDEQGDAACTRQSLDRIYRVSLRMQRLIADVVELARHQMGDRLSLLRRPSHMDALCRQAMEEIALNHPKRQVDLAVHGDMTGDWDPDRVLQAVANLLSNAIQYSPAHTPIGITLSGTGPTVNLSVTNQGPPIPEAEMASLFDPFKRTRNASGGPQKTGLGLGLYIVHLIVTAHEGRIDLFSGPRQGTTVTVQWPRHGSESCLQKGLR